MPFLDVHVSRRKVRAVPFESISLRFPALVAPLTTQGQATRAKGASERGATIYTYLELRYHIEVLLHVSVDDQINDC